MTATILDGKAAAAAIKTELAERVAALRERGIVPGIATVLVGADPASQLYVGMKHKQSEAIGMNSIQVELPAESTQEEVEAVIDGLNADPACHGYIVQLPLPKHLDTDAILERIDQGLTHHRALAPAEDEALLTRGERNLDAWIDEMNILGTADAYGYRMIAIPRERLWAVLENPGADPSARQGAALALRARLDDEERERLVSIGQKSASPRLRVAIDAVARGPNSSHLRIAFDESDDEVPFEPPRAARPRSQD